MQVTADVRYDREATRQSGRDIKKIDCGQLKERTAYSCVVYRGGVGSGIIFGPSRGKIRENKTKSIRKKRPHIAWGTRDMGDRIIMENRKP